MIWWIALAACRPTEPDAPVPVPTRPHGDTATTPGEPPASADVLLVILDDVGTDKLAAYGSFPGQPVTPTVDALAAAGVRFDRAYSAPTCSPSRAEIFTGRYGRRMGIGRWILPTDDTWSLSADELTLPEVLAGAPVPWSTALVGKWHLVSYDRPDPAAHPAESGFTDFTGSLGNLGVPLDTANGTNYFAWEKVVDRAVTRSETYATTDQADEAIARLSTLAEPFCLILSFNAGHVPLHVPPAGLFTSALSDPPTDAEQFAAMIEAADHELGRVLDAMDPDVRARTTVIALGDNGTDSDWILPPFDPDRSKSTMYDGGARIPLIISGPLVDVPGSASEALVQTVDLLPTLAALAGAPLPVDRTIDGTSLLPLLADPAAPFSREYAWSDDFFPNGPPPYKVDEAMVRDAGYKLIRKLDGPDHLYRYQPGALDEGPDLSAAGPLTADEQAELDALGAEMDRMYEELAYEGR